MPLVRGPNGGLLRGPNGGLAASTSCCCDDECQTCCIKITSGALIGGVIKVFATSGSNTLEIDITTQSGTRLVCDGESVTLAIKYRDGSHVAYLINSMVVSFDPAWKYGSNSPAEDSKHEYPGGFVYWENTTAEEYTVTLSLRNCFFYPYPSLGAITVNGDDFEEVIAIQVCSVSTPCCTQPWECSPCCWAMQKLTVGASDFVNYAPPFDWHWNSTLLRWEHLEYSNGFWFLAWIKPPDAEHITLYCKDELFDIGLEIGSEDPLLVNQIKGIPPADPGPIKVEFVTGDFYEDMTTELPAGATLVPGLDTITWEEEKAFSYKASIKHDCENPGQEQIVFKAWIDLDGDSLQSVTDPSVEAVLLLEECENPGQPCCICCDDCYLDEAFVTDLDITEGGSRFRLLGGPYSLSLTGDGRCTWIIGVTDNAGTTGTVALSYDIASGGWILQGFNSFNWIDGDYPGVCSGQLDVTSATATGFILIEGGLPCPGF